VVQIKIKWILSYKNVWVLFFSRVNVRDFLFSNIHHVWPLFCMSIITNVITFRMLFDVCFRKQLALTTFVLRSVNASNLAIDIFQQHYIYSRVGKIWTNVLFCSYVMTVIIYWRKTYRGTMSVLSMLLFCFVQYVISFVIFFIHLKTTN